MNTLTLPSPLLHFSLKAFFWLSFVATFVFCAPFFTADDPLPPIPSEVATVATQVSESGTSGELVTPEASALQPEVRILKEERKRLLGYPNDTVSLFSLIRVDGNGSCDVTNC